MFSENDHPLKFLHCTHDGEVQPEVQAVRESVEKFAEKKGPTPLESVVDHII